jgi:CMP-N-acetylneuraminic acid synthetase
MITAIIPARSGSKRLIHKNITPLNGKPLVFYTIDSVLNHEDISQIVFTTDSQEYIDLVYSHYGDKLKYELRPEEYGSDTTKVYDEIRRLYNDKIVTTQWYLLCLPTCPLRDYELIKGLLEQWRVTQKSIFTCVEYDFPVQFGFSINEDNTWQPLLKETPMLTGNTRSQDIGKLYRPNGAAYLQNRDNLNNITLYIDSNPYLMNRDQSVDVDTKLDFIYCETLLSNKEI